MRNKRAEMGIGTLIIFIALLLVAAIAAGVLIQTSGSLQEKALMTGDQAKGQIATNVRVVEVSATDGSSGYLNDFFSIIKLAPGSDAIKLSQTLFTMNSFDRTATLKYAGVNGTCTNSVTGYNTWNVESISGSDLSITKALPYSLSEDYDDDQAIDTLYVDDLGNVVLQMSSIAVNTTLSSASIECGGAQAAFDTSVTVGDGFVASVHFSGTCQNNVINGTNMTVNVTPSNLGQGYFAVEYLQRGANPVAGNLQRGDVIKICFEGPKNIGEDEKIRLNFIPKIGTPTLTEFITPEVISTERVYLYP